MAERVNTGGNMTFVYGKDYDPGRIPGFKEALESDSKKQKNEDVKEEIIKSIKTKQKIIKIREKPIKPIYVGSPSREIKKKSFFEKHNSKMWFLFLLLVLFLLIWKINSSSYFAELKQDKELKELSNVAFDEINWFKVENKSNVLKWNEEDYSLALFLIKDEVDNSKGYFNESAKKEILASRNLSNQTQFFYGKVSGNFTKENIIETIKRLETYAFPQYYLLNKAYDSGAVACYKSGCFVVVSTRGVELEKLPTKIQFGEIDNRVWVVLGLVLFIVLAIYFGEPILWIIVTIIFLFSIGIFTDKNIYDSSSYKLPDLKKLSNGLSSNSDRDIGAIEVEILSLVNEERQRNGLRALTVKSDLNLYARSWSEKMISQDFFEHSNLDFF
ncbi:MAG: CAP domain-containing protein, partial [Nanoarchaeota archaeon]